LKPPRWFSEAAVVTLNRRRAGTERRRKLIVRRAVTYGFKLPSFRMPNYQKSISDTHFPHTVRGSNCWRLSDSDASIELTAASARPLQGSHPLRKNSARRTSSRALLCGRAGSARSLAGSSSGSEPPVPQHDPFPSLGPDQPATARTSRPVECWFQHVLKRLAAERTNAPCPGRARQR